MIKEFRIMDVFKKKGEKELENIKCLIIFFKFSQIWKLVNFMNLIQ